MDLKLISQEIKAGNMFLVGSTILTKTQYEEFTAANVQADYFDMKQGVKKVLLNSSYGASLSEYCRFHDPRIGASTTGTGRQITTHMIELITETLSGQRKKLVKTTSWNEKKGRMDNDYTIETVNGLGAIYGDTDSCYFSMDGLVSNGDEAIACADATADIINNSFPQFMKDSFLCRDDFSIKIRAGREIVARTGIFSAKKKYILYAHDIEGSLIDPDSPKALKTMGSDIKLSSTPDMIKSLLTETVMMILREQSRDGIDDLILDFRSKLGVLDHKILNILDLAAVSGISTYGKYYDSWYNIENQGKGRVTMPGQVRAAINYNSFIQKKGIQAPILTAADKIKILWLRPNDMNYVSFGFPSDTDILPEWFLEHFEIDIKTTEQKLVDQKLKNIFDPLGWQVPTIKTQVVKKLLAF